MADKVDMGVLEQARIRAAARALHDVTNRAFQSVYPAACELVGAFNMAKMPYVAEAVTHAHIWATVALCKIVGGKKDDLHKMVDVDWDVVQPDLTDAGKKSMETARSSLVGPGGAPLPASPPKAPKIVAERPQDDDEPPASA